VCVCVSVCEGIKRRGWVKGETIGGREIEDGGHANVYVSLRLCVRCVTLLVSLSKHNVMDTLSTTVTLTLSSRSLGTL
jgi:hypothetical protein